MSKKLLIIGAGIIVVAATFIFFKEPLSRYLTGFLVERGNYYFNGGAYNIAKAARFYKGALVIDSEHTIARYQLSRIYFVDGEYEKALKEINAVIEKAPAFGHAYYMRGLINGFTNNLDQGEKDFKKIFELAKLNPETTIPSKTNGWAVYNDLAWIQFQKGNYADVETSARAGLEEYPENPWLLNSLGLALTNLEGKEEARVFFLQAAEHAEKLTSEDIIRAYPGNNPQEAANRRLSMINTIALNLTLLEN